MAHWIHFKYNKKKGRYEHSKPSPLRHLYTAFRHLLTGTVMGAIILYAFIFWVGSPSLWRLEKEHATLQQHYRLLDRRLDEALEVLEDIGQRDDNLYRVILQGEPIGQEARQRLMSNSQRYDSLLSLMDADLVIKVTQKMDIIERELYLQSRSFDEVGALYDNQEDRLRCIPSIQPIRGVDLKQLASGFGYRIDPVYNILEFHAGMDFAAEKGTDIFATGDARVSSAGYDSGYGLCVVLDHGYGYVTRYAHMSKMHVKAGQTVRRGDRIGEVGSTGKSTGNHLHYEVILNGQVQNPANYYFMDLTPEQYEAMLEVADNQGRAMD